MEKGIHYRLPVIRPVLVCFGHDPCNDPRSWPVRSTRRFRYLPICREALKDLAGATGKRADLISRWLRRGAVKQKEDPELQQLAEAIDQYLRVGPN